MFQKQSWSSKSQLFKPFARQEKKSHQHCSSKLPAKQERMQGATLLGIFPLIQEEVQIIQKLGRMAI